MWLVQSTMTLISDTLNGNILPNGVFLCSLAQRTSHCQLLSYIYCFIL